MPTALLIEDDDPTSALLAELLYGLGVAVERFVETEAAIQAAAHRRPDLVVTDLWVGPDHARAWQNIGRLREASAGAPFLLLTGHHPALDEAKRRGYRVLLKPFDLEEFEYAVRDMLRP